MLTLRTNSSTSETAMKGWGKTLNCGMESQADLALAAVWYSDLHRPLQGTLRSHNCREIAQACLQRIYTYIYIIYILLFFSVSVHSFRNEQQKKVSSLIQLNLFCQSVSRVFHSSDDMSKQHQYVRHCQSLLPNTVFLKV